MPRDNSTVIVASTWTFNPDAVRNFMTHNGLFDANAVLRLENSATISSKYLLM